jgi:hypothetical protein
MKATLDGALRLASVHFGKTDGEGIGHEARYSIFVFGRVAEGSLAGLVAHSVET